MSLSGAQVTRIDFLANPTNAYALGAFADKRPSVVPPRATAEDIIPQSPITANIELENYLYKNFETIQYILANSFTGTVELAGGKIAVIEQGIITAIVD